MTKTFIDKLIAFQSAVEATKKAKENPFHKSRYADINAFLDVIKPVLSANSLFLYQPIRTLETGEMYLDTIITDGTDELRSSLPIPQTGKIQELGASITYLRRYSIQSLLALEAEDDDVKSVKDAKPKAKTYIKPSPPITKQIETAVTQAKSVDDLIVLDDKITTSKTLTKEDKEFLTRAIEMKIGAFKKN